ncbi:hypothetical protein [Novosphingobium sp. BL-8A]|uniref:hypothetical protein n=1 Tax=Novosphingobium sp. BL-8A TaxID=3127639 RepID=UPI003756D65A
MQFLTVIAALSSASLPNSAAAQPIGTSVSQPPYAKMVDLARKAKLVIKAQVTSMSPLPQAHVTAPLHGMYYVEAKTQSLLYGDSGIGGSLRYLVELPLDGSGRAANLKGENVLLFAWRVPNQAEDLKLVEPGAQQIWTPEGEMQLRSILRGLVSARSLRPVTRVREIGYVAGNLAGQGRTQIFLDTQKGPATITVRHAPGAGTSWGVSFGEVAGGDPHPPAKDSLEWYSLACFLPPSPAQDAYVSRTFAAKQQAYQDYRMVLGDLGPCVRD